MKTLTQFLAEAARHDELKHHILDHMKQRYGDVAGDLPRHGDHHYDSAHDHLRDHAYDHFRQHPDFDRRHHNLSSLATKALKHYGVDDRTESRKNDARREKRHVEKWVRNDHPPRPPKKRAKSWQERGGYTTWSTPGSSKPKRGIGSY